MRRSLIVAATLLLGAAHAEEAPKYLLPEPQVIYPDDPKLPPYVEGEGHPLPLEPEVINPHAEQYRYPRPYNPPPVARAPDPEPYYKPPYEAYRKPDYRYYNEPYYDEREYRAYRKERRREKVRKFIDKAHMVLDILGRFAQ